MNTATQTHGVNLGVLTAAVAAGLLIEYVPQPFMTEWVIDFQPFPFAAAKAAGEITVEVMAHTKTRLIVGFRHKNKYESIDIIPPGSEGFKFHQVPNRKRWYFVVSKKQHRAAFEQHVKNLVCHLFNITEGDSFKIKIVKCRAFREAFEA